MPATTRESYRPPERHANHNQRIHAEPPKRHASHNQRIMQGRRIATIASLYTYLGLRKPEHLQKSCILAGFLAGIV